MGIAEIAEQILYYIIVLTMYPIIIAWGIVKTRTFLRNYWQNRTPQQ
jgi:hypothetical protein